MWLWLCAGSGQPLPGLEACKSPNTAALPDGCLGAQPAIGIDQFGLWCVIGLDLPCLNVVQLRSLMVSVLAAHAIRIFRTKEMRHSSKGPLPQCNAEPIPLDN